MTDQWHRPLAHLRGSELQGETTPTPGMQRFVAVTGTTVGAEKLWMGRVHVQAATSSGNHHHGEAETAIYVVSGTPRFVFAQGSEEVVIDAAPGDFVFVPPWVPHREENPGSEESVVVVSRSNQEGTVVNLSSLWPESGASPAVGGPGAV